MSTNVVIDEMFPDEAGSSFMEVDDGQLLNGAAAKDGYGGMLTETLSKGGVTMVHTEFHNDFGDIFDDDDLS